MPNLKKTMFREYDIRGKEASDELTPETMYYIGRGFGTYLKRKGRTEAVVGHDVRATSEEFYQEVTRGLNDCGVNVIDIGAVTTPMGYWAQHFFDIKGGAIVTASHNPVGWNGAKISDDLSKTLSGQEIQDVYQLISNDDFEIGQGSTRQEYILDNYMEDLLSKVKIDKKFKVLVNTGNGTASVIAPEILRRAGCEVVEHNTNIDPTYPNYTPNPENPAMMKDTVEQVKKHHCDLGFAFDGDGDRLGMVDEEGHIMPADIILILLSRLLLEKHPGSRVMFDVKVSEALPEDIKNHGGIPIMYRTGHSFIKAKMHQEQISLTGEMSGHIFLGHEMGYYGFDDSIISALKILEYLSQQKRPLSQIIKGIPRYISTSIINIDAADEIKHQIVENITKQFKQEGYRVVDVDGARVYTEDGWGLVRASNTTPLLVLRFESKTEDGIKRLKKVFREKLESFEGVGKEWKETK